MVSQYTNVNSDGSPLDVEGYVERYGGGGGREDDVNINSSPVSESTVQGGGRGVPEVQIEGTEVQIEGGLLRGESIRFQIGGDFQYYPPNPNNFQLIEPPIRVLVEGNTRMKLCIIGNLVYGDINIETVRRDAFELWSDLGLVDVGKKSENTYLFRFRTLSGKNAVLATKFWDFGEAPMWVHAWDEIEAWPRPPRFTNLWVKLSNVPDAYWSNEGLSYLASAIGKPLYADEATSRLEMRSFAMICVEYEYGKPLPSFLNAMVIDPVHVKKFAVRVDVDYPLSP